MFIKIVFTIYPAMLHEIHTQEVPGHTQRSRGPSQVALLLSEVNDVLSLFSPVKLFSKGKQGIIQIT